MNTKFIFVTGGVVSSLGKGISPASSEVMLLGDIDSDGDIDVSDLSELSLALIGDSKLTVSQKISADVDKDGKVTLSDLARMRQFLSKTIEAF